MHEARGSGIPVWFIVVSDWIAAGFLVFSFPFRINLLDCLLIHCALSQGPGRDMEQAPNLCSCQEALVSTSTWEMGEAR